MTEKLRVEITPNTDGSFKWEVSSDRYKNSSYTEHTDGWFMLRQGAKRTYGKALRKALSVYTQLLEQTLFEELTDEWRSLGKVVYEL